MVAGRGSRGGAVWLGRRFVQWRTSRQRDREDLERDYQRALDAYESAQRAVPRINRADEISKVTDTLSAGRYALV